MKTAYTDGIILNGKEDMTEQKGYTVVVDQGRIVNILPPGGLLPSDCEIVSLHGCYLMPGLINLHVHLNSGGRPSAHKKEPEDYVRLVKMATSNPITREMVCAMIRGYAHTQLESGVTTIRTGARETGRGMSLNSAVRAARTGMTRIPIGPAVPDGIGALLRGGTAGSSMLGPRILTANTGITVPGGHVAGSLAYPVYFAEEAAEYVRNIAKDRPDLIKLMITGGIMDAEREGEPGVLKMSPEIIRAACDEAHKLGLPVAAHVESAEGVLAALRGGVDTIEHGAMPDEEMTALFHETGASLVTTISPVLPLALLDITKTHVRPMDRHNAGVVLCGIIECARNALKEGIPVGLGTDSGCPYVTQYDMWRELQYFQNFCGVTAKNALYTATLGNAKIAGIADETGSIEEGKAADFVITAGNPLESLRALRKPRMIVARGEKVTPAIKKDVEIEQTLDSLLRYTYEDLDALLAGIR